MLTHIRTLATEVLDLFYPRTCAACRHGQPVRDGIFCVDCLADLPETGFHVIADNPFERHFWGRVRIEAGSAFLFFVPGGKTQQLLHNIKYCGHSDYAKEIGRFYGRQLAESGRFGDIDLIIPVPLHWKRKRKRGFNQSTAFGNGLRYAMHLDIDTTTLQRKRRTSTQTRKTRADRIANMRDAFVVQRPEQIAGKHILLVDDVLTTGATMEACALTLLAAADVRVSMVTIACGRI